MSRFFNNNIRGDDSNPPPIFSSIAEYFQDHVNRLPSTRYEAALRRMSREEIRSANQNPVEFIYPFAKLLLIEITARIQNQTFHLESQFLEGAAGEADTRILEVSWAVIHDIEQDMSASFHNLTHFASSDPTKTAPLVGDFKALMRQIDRAQHDLREYLNRHVGMKSLEESRLAVMESRKSIELADSVKRLTQIALIFVPLNLVTSLFGMNFVEFGTGKLQIWVFVTVLCVLGLIVTMAVFFLFYYKKLKSRRTDPE